MPRLANANRILAYSINPLLPLLLRATRDLPSAQNELRWLREYAISFTKSKTNHQRGNAVSWRKLLRTLCTARSGGMPLQYILGTQPFGELEIKCRKGTLIPRPETDAYTTHLADLISNKRNSFLSVRSKAQGYVRRSNQPLRILDLCTGTGCIALLLQSLLAPSISNLQVLGIDISPQSVRLAQENLRTNIRNHSLAPSAGKHVQFTRGNIFADGFSPVWNPGTPGTLDGNGDDGMKEWDILISNPPYISITGFCKETSRSVRNWEPKLALVPKYSDCSGEEDGDSFYPRLLSIGEQARTKLVLLEVADLAQARRVVRTARSCASRYWQRIEIWRDFPSQGNASTTIVDGEEIVLLGDGHARAVICWGLADGSLISE
ncbi:MAG: hypothetical protein M1829_004138 [Trizodia sp. TS-e1964]|nr:MAG: hypothetical protein M1829_004138 [Trizodia sp. TS-e1964]